MWLLALLFADADRKGRLVMRKGWRVAPRAVAGGVCALLPLVSVERLGDTQLLSVGVGVSVAVVLWETVGGLECGAAVWERW